MDEKILSWYRENKDTENLLGRTWVIRGVVSMHLGGEFP